MKSDGILSSLGHAARGIRTAFATERNLTVHAIAAVIAVALAAALDFGSTEWGLLALAITFVFSTELMNTAVEILVDALIPDQSNAAKRVKDTAAGAVLVSSIGAVIVGLYLYLPRLIHMVGNARS